MREQIKKPLGSDLAERRRQKTSMFLLIFLLCKEVLLSKVLKGVSLRAQADGRRGGAGAAGRTREAGRARRATGSPGAAGGWGAGGGGPNPGSSAGGEGLPACLAAVQRAEELPLRYVRREDPAR